MPDLKLRQAVVCRPILMDIAHQKVVVVRCEVMHWICQETLTSVISDLNVMVCVEPDYLCDGGKHG